MGIVYPIAYSFSTLFTGLLGECGNMIFLVNIIMISEMCYGVYDEGDN